VTLRGTFRCFKPALQTEITGRIQHLTTSICTAFNVSATVVFNPENIGYPVTWNSEAETALALQAATAVVGTDNIDLNPTPSMGSEDFAFMLQEKPGCYVWIGNGSSANSCLLHNPHYDFNDEMLPNGVAYWLKLVKIALVQA
jgi:hippurate hydrolase